MSQLSRADDPRAAAAACYARGIELANRGFYQAALEQFTAAYAASPNFAVLYNIGQAEAALGHPVEAIDALSRYLGDAEDRVSAARRAQVQTQIGLLESRLATLSIGTDVPGVAIRIDGVDFGRAPLFQPIRVAAGTHTVAGSLEGHAEVTRLVTLGEGSRQRLELRLGTAADRRTRVSAILREPAPEDASLPDTAPIDLEARGRRLRLIAYVFAGVGAVSWGTALGVYLWNRGRYADWQAGQAKLELETRGSVSYSAQAAANNALAQSLSDANHAILGLSIVGGALVASGVTVFLIDWSQRRDAARLSVGWNGGSSVRIAWSGSW
jgi:tetratricopeptide (TPR) repeat protein